MGVEGLRRNRGLKNGEWGFGLQHSLSRGYSTNRGGWGNENRSNLMTVAFVVTGAASPTCRRFGECLIKEILYGKLVGLERDLFLFGRIFGER